MVQLTAAEQSTINGLLECIGSAIQQLDSVDPTYANKTKLQKLLYLAIEKFDLPVTYSWYLAGAVVPDDPATPADLHSTIDNLPRPDTPSVPSMNDAALDKLQTDVEMSTAPDIGEVGPDSSNIENKPDEPSVAPDEGVDVPDPVLFTGGSGPTEDDDPLDGRRDDIIDFYISTIPDVWRQNTMRFLQNFYLEYAPVEFRELYVQSTHLRTRLRDVENVVDAHVHGREPDQDLVNLSVELGRDISDLHCSIRESDALDDTFRAVVRGTDAIEDGLMVLADRNPDDLDEAHLDVVDTMQDFFYYWVWRYPCLVMSRDTATGPCAAALRDARRDQLETFEQDLLERTAEFEDELAAADLLPGQDDYQAVGDEVDDAITSLADQYFK
jgi:hypothetical protein